MLAVLTVHLRLPGCASLKEKRSRLKPLLHRLRREFNLSTAELEMQDEWGRAVIGCAMLGNDAAHLRTVSRRCADGSKRTGAMATSLICT